MEAEVNSMAIQLMPVVQIPTMGGYLLKLEVP